MSHLLTVILFEKFIRMSSKNTIFFFQFNFSTQILGLISIFNTSLNLLPSRVFWV